MKVKLVNNAARSSSSISNSIPLDIFIGVFDCDGNWVTENISQEPILKGMTSMELYHGKGQFTKLFFQEINSNLPKEKLNLAIYAKPSLQRGSSDHRYSSNVCWDQVKPLIIKNVNILSKKRKSGGS